jgi:hypothetical protein
MDIVLHEVSSSLSLDEQKSVDLNQYGIFVSTSSSFFWLFEFFFDLFLVFFEQLICSFVEWVFLANTLVVKVINHGNRGNCLAFIMFRVAASHFIYALIKQIKSTLFQV